MAPNNPQGPLNDPDRIDIRLDLLGEGSLAAMNQLTAQLASVTQHLSQFGGLSPEGQVAAMHSGSLQGGIMHGGHGYRSIPTIPMAAAQQGSAASRPPDLMSAAENVRRASMGEPPLGGGGSSGGTGSSGASLPPDNPMDPSRLARMTFMRRLGEYRRSNALGPSSLLHNEVGVVIAREGYQARKRGGADPHNPSLGSGYHGYTDNPTGGVSTGASLPPTGESVTDPQWLQGLKADRPRYERAQEGFELPQFGEFTVQNKLNMAADILTRSASSAWRSKADQLPKDLTEEAARTAMGTTGAGRGYSANLLRMAADNVAVAHTVRSEFGRMLSQGQGLTTAGVQLGYDRGTQINIPGTDFGFTLPGGGTMEGIRQRFNVQRLRMRAGVTGEQANQVIGSLAGQGFGGREGQNMAFDFISDLVAQGQNPEIASTMFGKAVRNGNASMGEVAKTLSNLGDVAKATRMTLDEAAQALDQFAEQAQGTGATYAQGLALGKQVSLNTGLTPQQSAQFLNSPLMGGIGMMNQNILPNEIGLLGSTAAGQTAFTGNMFDTVDMAMQAAKGMAREIRDKDGNVIVSAEDAQINQAAQFAQIDVETFRRLQKNAPRLKGLTGASAALSKFSATRDRAANDVAGARARDADFFKRGGDESTLDPRTSADARQRDANRMLGQDWNAIDKQLRAVAPKSGKERDKYLHEVADISKDSNMGDRARRAQSLIAQQSKAIMDTSDGRPQVRVDFTPQAARFFKQIEGELPEEFKKHNQGGPARNEAASGHFLENAYSSFLDTAANMVPNSSGLIKALGG